MKEIGFWDYTCPAHGSLENYTKADWDVLLDDMVEGGFNSLVICPKWLTTGYKSSYDWLDQDPSIAAIQTDNATIHHALQGAKKRGMRTWILVVASIFHVEKFGIKPASPSWVTTRKRGEYDLDQPGVGDRIEMLFGELARLFGKDSDGFIIEFEQCDHEAPHRVALYEQWAKENNRPDFATIKNVALQPRSYPFVHWRDFTTSRRIAMYRRVEKSLRENGFNGTISTIAEMANGPTYVCGNVNLTELHRQLPTWPVLTYDDSYNRHVNRLATRDICMDQPKKIGLETQWLTRGVMTWNWPADAPALNLEEQWRMSMEDAIESKPDVLWFMVADARHEGLGADIKKLPQWGFSDGRTARKRLMAMAKEMGLAR